MDFLVRIGHHQGIFNILGERGINVALFTKIYLMCFVIPNTCIDQEVMVGLIWVVD